MTYQHQMILYVADRRINQLMRNLDMCQSNKAFIVSTVADFNASREVNEEFFKNLLDKTREDSHDQETWIAAVQYNGVLFPQPGLQILSDGEREMFIPPEFWRDCTEDSHGHHRAPS